MGMEAGFNRPPSGQPLPDVGLFGGDTPWVSFERSRVMAMV